MLVVFFVLVSTVYSIANPAFEAPDEVYHYPYIKHLADGKGLPVQKSETPDLWEQEGSQPPLYYAVSALLTRWVNTDDLAQVRQLNPHATIGIPLAEDNKNMVIHGPRPEWPWRGAILALHVVRLFSVLLGAGTLWGTGRLATCLFPHRPMVRPVAIMLTALNPMFLFIGASVNNDNMVCLLATWTVVLLTRLVLDGGTSRRRLVTAGVLIGLACLAKLSGLALVPLAVLALGLARLERLRRQQGGKSLRATVCQLAVQDRWAELEALMLDLVTVLVPVLLIAGWWYWRNWTLYGDPTGLATMLAIFGRRKAAPGILGLLQEFQGFRISYWGLFGVVNVLLRPRWVYTLLDGLMILCLAGLARRTYLAVKGRRVPRRAWALALSAIWVLVVGASLVRWTSMTKATQGRLVFPAIAVTSSFLAFGFLSWVRPRHSHLALWLLGLPLGLLAVATPFVAIRPAYPQPVLLTAAQLPASARPLGVSYGEGIVLRAIDIGDEATVPGGEFPVTLYWECTRSLDRNYSLYVHLFGHEGQALGQRDSYPGGGMYPTSQWRVGDIFADRYMVAVEPDGQFPVAAEVEVGIYDLDTMRLLPARDAAGQPVGRPIIGRIKVGAATTPAWPTTSREVTLQGVRLRGYDLLEGSVCRGGQTVVRLHWQVTGDLAPDYSVFVHLVDDQGRMLGQGDGPPLGGAYPTQYWEAGEYLIDEHVLQVAAVAGPGVGQIVIGLYDRRSGQRLPVLDATGAPMADSITLGTLVVEDCR
jgi:hypothetical protein